ncbi:hypothetical protein H0H93_010920, partial [Arthromyces matolae]
SSTRTFSRNWHTLAGRSSYILDKYRFRNVNCPWECTSRYLDGEWKWWFYGRFNFQWREIRVVAILHHWNWAWTFQGVTINNCKIGFDFLLGVSAVSVIDAVIRDTPIAFRSAAAINTTLTGSLILNNVHLHNVEAAVADGNNSTILDGGSNNHIESWGQGNVYSGTSSQGSFQQGPIGGFEKPHVLLDGAGRIFGKTHPQYADYSVDQFLSVKDHGACGDGRSDDTASLQRVLNEAAGCKIVFFDAGTYIISSTLTIPAGTRMVGEAWSVIAGKGDAFSDLENPQVVVRVGEKYSRGIVEITDMIFTTVGPAPGAIVVEWNIKEPEWHKGGAGMWDSHIRLGGVMSRFPQAAGTKMELSQCPTGGSDVAPCMAAFLALHLMPDSSAYLEGTWVWLADHDLDGDGASQISLYSGRGILSESKGPPYWQPVPPAPEPFVENCAFHDPEFSENTVSAWALSVESSKHIVVFGVVNQSDNLNGFVSTVTFWAP